jgi:MYXO-CTERM domain-containing protein
MKPFSSNLFRVASLALALPILGLCSTLNVNGTCYGPCSTTALSTGQSTFGYTDGTITVGADTFSLHASYGASYDHSAGSFITIDPTVTYTGTGLSGNDTITIDFLQNYFDNVGSSFDGTYTEHVPLQLSAATGGTVELFIDGQGVGAVGPYGPGSYDVTKSADLSGLTSTTLAYDYQFVFTFNGASPGATASSTPEPAQTIPAALSLAGFALVALRRRKQ